MMFSCFQLLLFGRCILPTHMFYPNSAMWKTMSIIACELDNVLIFVMSSVFKTWHYSFVLLFI